MKRNIAVILSAGSGERAGFSRPKQLTRLAGKPIVAHTIERFERHLGISEIAIVTNEGCLRDIEDIVVRYQFKKVRKILLGGEERYESSLAAISAYSGTKTDFETKLIFHDAVRPLVSDRIISDVIKALDHYNAVDVVVPASDTVVVANQIAGTIASIPDRSTIRLGQTPQGFALETIRQAYERALQDAKFKTTDDCNVVLRYGNNEQIFLVEGDRSNIKLTYSDDLPILDKLMQSHANRLLLTDGAGMPNLSRLRGKTLAIIGGTSGIGAGIVELATAHGAQVYSGSRSTGVDIASPEGIAKFLNDISARHDGIDAIISTAAALSRQPLAQMTAAAMRESLEINLFGAFTVAREGFPHLAKKRGHLLLFASSSYTYGRPFYSTYSASKAAIVNLTQALADEWADDGVKINCINPQRTRTSMRVKAFGIEPPESLLEPADVARKSLAVVLGDATGTIYDITKL